MPSRPSRQPAAPLLAATLCVSLLAGLMLVSGQAHAACGCTDDGHGNPQGPKANGASSWLASLLDWQPARRSEKAGAAR